MEYHFKEIRTTLLKAIDEAEFIIYCAVAWITDIDVINTLIAKSKDGVKIELLINDDDAFASNRKHFLPFIDAGGKLYLYPKGGGLMHNKFCVIDLTTVVTGSFNWTHSAATKHEENIIIERNNILMSKDFSRQFNKLKRSSIVFQNIEKSSNNDLFKYVDVVDVMFMTWDEYPLEVIDIVREEEGKAGVDKLYRGQMQIFVKDEDKQGIFVISNDDQIEIPDKIFGYWNGLMTSDPNEEYYSFICLDPLLIKYT